MITPLAPFRYAITAGILMSLTLSGVSGTVRAFKQDNPSVSQDQTIQISNQKPAESDGGTIKTNSVKKLYTPTPKPTPTPIPKVNKTESKQENIESSKSSNKRTVTVPIQPQPRQNTTQKQQVPAAPAQNNSVKQYTKPSVPQAPVKRPTQNTQRAATQNDDDDDAAWEAQRKANPNNQQKSGDLNYDSTPRYNGVTIHGGF